MASTIEIMITSTRPVDRLQRYTPMPQVTATSIPCPRPTPASFNVTPSHWRGVISRSTSPRIVTARACAPELPDCPATTGSNTASAVYLAIVDSKRPTTAAARNAVSRLICSQGSRLRTANSGGDRARSSGLAPLIIWMSAERSSCIAWIKLE